MRVSTFIARNSKEGYGHRLIIEYHELQHVLKSRTKFSGYDVTLDVRGDAITGVFVFIRRATALKKKINILANGVEAGLQLSFKRMTSMRRGRTSSMSMDTYLCENSEYGHYVYVPYLPDEFVDKRYAASYEKRVAYVGEHAPSMPGVQYESYGNPPIGHTVDWFRTRGVPAKDAVKDREQQPKNGPPVPVTKEDASQFFGGAARVTENKKKTREAVEVLPATETATAAARDDGVQLYDIIEQCRSFNTLLMEYNSNCDDKNAQVFVRTIADKGKIPQIQLVHRVVEVKYVEIDLKEVKEP